MTNQREDGMSEARRSADGSNQGSDDGNRDQASSCHCGCTMTGGADHCAYCGCEHYEATCGAKYSAGDECAFGRAPVSPADDASIVDATPGGPLDSPASPDPARRADSRTCDRHGPADSPPATSLKVGDAVTDIDNTEYAATCPTCGTVGKARAAYRQATRREPCTFLGFQGYCRPCGDELTGMMPFPATDVQLPLGADHPRSCEVCGRADGTGHADTCMADAQAIADARARADAEYVAEATREGSDYLPAPIIPCATFDCVATTWQGFAYCESCMRLRNASLHGPDPLAHPVTGEPPTYGQRWTDPATGDKWTFRGESWHRADPPPTDPPADGPDLPPILRALQDAADATPDGGEGSRFHSRSEFTWQLVDDYLRASRGEDMSDCFPGMSMEQVVSSCLSDAAAAIERWRGEDAD